MTATGEPITEGQLFSTAYDLVAETGQYMEDCRTCPSRVENSKTWTKFQYHSIKALEDLRKSQQNSLQGGYAGVANNLVGIQYAFA